MTSKERIHAALETLQLEMFGKRNDSSLDYIGEDGITCNACGLRQPPDQFHHMPSGEIKRKCNTCKRNQSRLVKQLREENPYPDDDYKCPICKRDMNEISQHGQMRMQTWVLDHCHDSETFRGWLCFNCNSGLGQFKDELRRIKNAAIYLEEHQKNESSS